VALLACDRLGCGVAAVTGSLGRATVLELLALIWPINRATPAAESRSVGIWLSTLAALVVSSIAGSGP